ncbi:DinG family ATP-dependent helicase YoaA [Vibrio sp. JCM 18904]|nr:DinG family ATP-dependent helicase YoaA [Vibrio sp. JCM 18904]
MIAKTFSSDGALGKAIPGFQARQPQIDMAEASAVRSKIKPSWWWRQEPEPVRPSHT